MYERLRLAGYWLRGSFAFGLEFAELAERFFLSAAEALFVEAEIAEGAGFAEEGFGLGDGAVGGRGSALHQTQCPRDD